jgi:transcriptional regulator with XRE-family HTH domain
MTLGERIRQQREQRGMSQAELARRIGVSKNTMNIVLLTQFGNY